MNTSNNMVFKSSSMEETKKIGEIIGGLLRPKMIVGFIGDFGAGKTALIKAISKYFNINENFVTSPSFTLVNEYKGREKIIHFDVYRLNDETEFELLDLDYYIEQDALIFIEWADKFINLLPKNSSMIEITIINENEREIVWRKNS